MKGQYSADVNYHRSPTLGDPNNEDSQLRVSAADTCGDLLLAEQSRLIIFAFQKRIRNHLRRTKAHYSLTKSFKTYQTGRCIFHSHAKICEAVYRGNLPFLPYFFSPAQILGE